MRIESAIEAGGVSDELVGRIYRAGPKRAGEEVAALSAAERAFTVIEGGLADADEADAEAPAEDAPREEVA
jgi:hypothetical protein